MSSDAGTWVGSLGDQIGIAEDALRLIIGMTLGNSKFCTIYDCTTPLSKLPHVVRTNNQRDISVCTTECLLNVHNKLQPCKVAPKFIQYTRYNL